MISANLSTSKDGDVTVTTTKKECRKRMKGGRETAHAMGAVGGGYVRTGHGLDGSPCHEMLGLGRTPPGRSDPTRDQTSGARDANDSERERDIERGASNGDRK